MGKSVQEGNEYWLRLKNGDREALGFIYTQHIDNLIGYGTTINNDRELIKDCIQELFVALWQQRENLSIPTSVKTYLLISLKRLVLKKAGSGNRKTSLHISYVNDEVESPAADERVMANEADAQLNTTLFNSINTLTARQREAIHLRFYQELGYPEMAEILGLNNQGVRNLVYKAIQGLRKVLVPH